LFFDKLFAADDGRIFERLLRPDQARHGHRFAGQRLRAR
jgi:hypothetical protein